MKKLFAMLMAVLMMALPVCSLGESPVATAKELAAMDPMARYMLEGQEATMDIRLEVGDTVFALAELDEETQAAVKDLLDALTIRLTAQTVDHQAQAGLNLLSGEESLADAKVAYGQRNVYAASNLLGEKIVRITWPQIKDLGNQMLDQMVAEGQISRETVDSAKRFLRLAKNDPAAALQKLIGEPNLEPLMNAAMPIVMSVEMNQVEEAPEAFPEAAAVITVPLQKEALTGVTTELAKVIWSLPAVQKLAPYVTEGPKTEEEWIAALNRIPEALAEDGEVKVYTDEAGTSLYMVSALKIKDEDEIEDFGYEALIRVQDAGMTMEYTLSMEEMTMKGQMDVTVTADSEGGNEANVNYHITSEAQEDGATYQPVEEIIAMTVFMSEKRQVLDMDMTVRVQPEPEAEAVGIQMKITDESTDLGDHAEENAAFTASVDGLGELLTLRMAGKTDLAEAYIITEDAVEPLSMSEEELNAFVEEVQMSAQQALFGALSKLPASFMKLLGN